MKKLSLILLTTTLLIWSCGNDQNKAEEELPAGFNKLTVLEHMNGGGYTFMKGEKDGNDMWIAVRETPVEVGDVFYFTSTMEMENFESKSVNKTFDKILFVDNISKTPPQAAQSGNNSGMPGMGAAPDGHTKPKVDAVNDVKVTPLSDGLTVEAANKDRISLAGKTVKIRGVVTKFNGGIMGKNWIHIQDGTGGDGTNDLTITSDQSAKVGETIVIEGTVATDKDFGSGYFYDVIIENTKITVEKAI